MRRHPEYVAVVRASGAVIIACLVGLTAAEEPPRGLTVAPWKLESIELRDGRRLEGLVVDGADEEELSFVQIVRPPARPMYVITWGPLPRDRIRDVRRLPAAEHDRLVARVQAFRDDRDRRLNAETAVTLERDSEEGPWRYHAGEFTLESSAEPGITREAVVRLEQVFGGLANLAPPRADGECRDAAIRVRLCGTAAEYREVQESLGVRVANPAFFAPVLRLLVAGSDMPAIAAQHRLASEANAQASVRIAELDRQLSERLRALSADLEKQGVAAALRADIVQRARARWKQERDADLARIEAADRDNAARTAKARRTFYARLAHEAWHAYAETRLAPAAGDRLPAWLDEGLAQVVESAPLEAGELRLDAPDPVRLVSLQAILRDAVMPPLAELLRVGPQQFVAGHAGETDASGRAYLAAWGLALDLAVLEPVLTPASLAALCRSDAAADPVASFESLVGRPLAAFEADWRSRMLALRARGAAPVTPAP